MAFDYAKSTTWPIIDSLISSFQYFSKDNFEQAQSSLQTGWFFITLVLTRPNANANFSLWVDKGSFYKFLLNFILSWTVLSNCSQVFSLLDYLPSALCWLHDCWFHYSILACFILTHVFWKTSLKITHRQTRLTVEFLCNRISKSRLSCFHRQYQLMFLNYLQLCSSIPS